jgi:hypothetical protein
MSEFKPAQDYACGMISLMVSRLEEHQAEHGCAPAAFILHIDTSRMLRDETYKRFGTSEGPFFMGVPIKLCGCTEGPNPNKGPVDLIVSVDGRASIL